MRVLVVGAGGQLGSDVVHYCRHREDDVVALGRSDLDITSRVAVAEAIDAIRPHVLFNCAAWTAVDDCESDQQRADLINGAAVGFMSEACRSVDAQLVHVSTDYVFDGTKNEPYCENDEPHPTNAYGRSKLLGEQLAGPDACIVRTSWVFSKHGGNMVATLCRLMDSTDSLKFVMDQVGRPTYSYDLAVALRRVADERVKATLHCANQGPVSWFEFARAVFVSAGQTPERIDPIRTSDVVPQRAAQRPANSVLSTGVLDGLIGPLPDFRERLEEVVSTYRGST